LCDVFLERGDRVVLPAAECRVVARIQNSWNRSRSPRRSTSD
jgi:hypothetical protein